MRVCSFPNNWLLLSVYLDLRATVKYFQYKHLVTILVPAVDITQWCGQYNSIENKIL